MVRASSRRLIQLESTPAELSHGLSRFTVVDIDEHELFRMAGQEAGKYFDEALFFREIDPLEAVANEESMRTVIALNSQPQSRPLGADPVKPALVFGDLGFGAFKILGDGVNKRKEEEE